MLVLGLDTATPASTVAVAEVTATGMRGIADRRTVDPRAHGELLAPLIHATLQEAGIRPAELAAIVAGVGPGPFTGLRVGLATAAGMGQALGIPTYGVCSLDALGLAAGRGRVLVATDARRREVYHATYADGARVTEPQVARPADVVVDADRAVGEGALKYRDVFRLPIDEQLLYPPGVALIALAAGRIRASAADGTCGSGSPDTRTRGSGSPDAFTRDSNTTAGDRLTPLYLRRPDAAESAGRKPVLR